MSHVFIASDTFDACDTPVMPSDAIVASNAIDTSDIPDTIRQGGLKMSGVE